MAFKPETLRAYQNMEKTPLERIEDHEHLRLLEHGYKIKACIVEDKCISLDTMEDLPFIMEYLSQDSIYDSIRL